METYIEIDTGAWRFQPRVAAVCVWRDHVLLQHAIDGPFWVLPGGRLLPLERTADALVRTMRGEIGQDVAIGRLLWVMESITPIGGRPVHEIGFYYETDLPGGSPFHDLSRDHAGTERGHDLLLRWFPVDELAEVALRPEFLRAAIAHQPAVLQHIVRVDPGDPASNTAPG
jgi:8-oxo-dGTP pyrophosphatase MutT (NUDIX family)